MMGRSWRTRTCTLIGAETTVGVVSGLADANVIVLGETERSSFWADAIEGTTSTASNA